MMKINLYTPCIPRMGDFYRSSCTWGVYVALHSNSTVFFGGPCTFLQAITMTDLPNISLPVDLCRLPFLCRLVVKFLGCHGFWLRWFWCIRNSPKQRPTIWPPTGVSLRMGQLRNRKLRKICDIDISQRHIAADMPEIQGQHVHFALVFVAL